MSNGLTKIWWSRQYLFITFHEGGTGPLTFTMQLWQGFWPVWFYIALRVSKRWFRYSVGRFR